MKGKISYGGSRGSEYFTLKKNENALRMRLVKTDSPGRHRSVVSVVFVNDTAIDFTHNGITTRLEKDPLHDGKSPWQS